MWDLLRVVFVFAFSVKFGAALVKLSHTGLSIGPLVKLQICYKTPLSLFDSSVICITKEPTGKNKEKSF